MNNGSLAIIGLLSVLVMGLLPTFHTVNALQTEIYMAPQSSIFFSSITPLYYKFNVTVWVKDVSDLYAWQVTTYFNSTMLNATRAWRPTWDSEYVFFGKTTVTPPIGVGDDYIGVNDVLLGAQQPRFNGTGKLCIFELQIVKEPPEGGELSSILDINKDAPFETLLLDSDLNDIPVVKINGYYRFVFSSPVDLNADGKIDIKDIAITSSAFGSFPGHPRWNPICDLNNDNRVDIRDIALIAKNFGKTYP